MRRTREEAEKTRDDILDAAASLLVDKSFHSISLEMVARAAGVTRGAIYWHFKNKGEIYDALHARLHKSFYELITGNLAIEQPDSLQQLQDFFTGLLLNIESDQKVRNELTIFLLNRDYSGKLAIYREKHEEKKQEIFGLFDIYFERAKAKGLLTAGLDSRDMALAFTCYLDGIALHYLSNPGKFNMEDRALPLVHIFFERLRK